MSHSLAGAVRFTRTGRPIHVIVRGQGMKFRSKWCHYLDGAIHEECPPAAKLLCEWCRSKTHKTHRGAGAACALCVEKARHKPNWYQSKAEARTAQRLDRERADGRVLTWRRARAVVLQAAIPGQRAITYMPDFVVTYADGRIEALEVKSIATLTPVARVKIKMYRERARRYGWPLLRIVTGAGRELHV